MPVNRNPKPERKPTKKAAPRKKVAPKQKIEPIPEPVSIQEEPKANPQVLPSIMPKWNKYIPEVPTDKQLAAHLLGGVKELLFGGALAGGKSSFLLQCATQYVDVPGFAALILRRQLSDLKQPGALIERSHRWFGKWAALGECSYHTQDHVWIFPTKYPNGEPGPHARIQFGYAGDSGAVQRYQSAEFNLVCFDELCHWSDPSDYEYMFSRIRKTVCPIHKMKNGEPNFVSGCMYCDVAKAIPSRMRAATNPGPSWIKEKWGILPDPKLYATKQQAIIASMQGERIYYVGTHPDRVFIPSYMNDNEYVNWKEYEPVLKNLDPYTRKQLVEGNWDVRADSRFKRTWAKYYILRANDIVIDGEVIHFSRLKKIFTTVDPAATVKAGPVDGDTTKGAPSWTVISTWGLTMDDRLVWLDMQRFRKEIPDIIDCLERVHNKYQPSFHKIEYTGLGIGVAQFAEAAGLPVKKNVKKTDKIENSTSAMMFMKFGQIYFPGNAHWLDEAENEVFGWTGKPDEEDDIIDTLSDAATELTQRNAKETVTLINRHKSVAKFLDFRTIEQAKVAAGKGRFIGFGF